MKTLGVNKMEILTVKKGLGGRVNTEFSKQYATLEQAQEAMRAEYLKDKLSLEKLAVQGFNFKNWLRKLSNRKWVVQDGKLWLRTYEIKSV